MKPRTEREKLLMTLLPTILVLVFYAYKISHLNTRATSTDHALTAAQQKLPAPAQVQAERQRLDDLNKQLADVDKKTKDQETRWHKLQTARSNDLTLRVEAIERLTTLLHDNHLRLRDCEPTDSTTGGSAGQTGMPKELDRVVKLLADGKAELKPQLWRIRFLGSYVNVLLALEEVRTSEPLAIPIHLQMDEASIRTTVRNWTLYLWI